METLFSNSFIRDSVISTLKHNSKDGDGNKAERYSDLSSEIANSVTNTLNQPRLSSLEKKNTDQQSPSHPKEQVHHPYHIGSKRPSLLSATSYFNSKIIEKVGEQQSTDERKRVERVSHHKALYVKRATPMQARKSKTRPSQNEIVLDTTRAHQSEAPSRDSLHQSV